MNRNEACELLDKFVELLLKEGYLDTDFMFDGVMDEFILSKWFKEKYPIKFKEDE